jgi:putative flippase GtrA
MMRGTTQPMPSLRNDQTDGLAPVQQPSYYMTRWALLNRTLSIVEERTHGRAGLIQRFSTFLMVGGFAAVVQLTLFQIGLLIPLSVSPQLHNTLAYLVAAEISIFANFIPNDRITFSHLPGHDRSWLARCLRFHITCIAGVTLTFIIEVTLHFRVGLAAIVADAIGIIISLFFNFTVHHLFTYRHH